jgi:hypothetical protein
MTRDQAATPRTSAWSAKHAAKALLGYVIDTRLAGGPSPDRETVRVPDAWDAWWACFRAGIPLGHSGVRIQAGEGSCPDCSGHAALLAITDPPGHPGTDPGSCGCLLRWAEAMRSPGPDAGWPPSALSLAVIKPGADAGRIQGMLGAWFEVLKADEFALATTDTRRLYPEAYGAGYVAERDAYLTSGPVRVVILLARDPSVNPKEVKASIRKQLPDGDTLRNHLHMPDNPGEAFADIGMFAGPSELADLHRRHERDRAPARLAFYRTALGVTEPRADRLPASG